MRYSQMSALSLVALGAVIVSVAANPAKLDQVATAHHSRGFRAGYHDTGIWGANLQKQHLQLTPPNIGTSSSFKTPSSFDSFGHFNSANNFNNFNNLHSFNNPSPNKASNNFNNFNDFGGRLNTKNQEKRVVFVVAPSRTRQTGNKLSFGAKAIRHLGGDAVRKGSSSTLSRLVNNQGFASVNRGYNPPTQAASQQGYNYSPPATPVNLYQPPPPPPPTTTRRPPPPPTTTTTTRRPPPPPPTGLYQTPTIFNPIPLRPRPTTTTTTRRPRPPPPSPPTSYYQKPQASHTISQTRPRPIVQTPAAPMPAMPYEFAYGVNDADSGNYYTREESHDGNVMRGQYKVLLPDGRTQVVTYYDDGSGFNADVTYE